MFPIGDDNSARRRRPYVVYGLVAANIVMFLVQFALGDAFTNGWAAIPFEITHGVDLIGPETIRAGSESAVIVHGNGPTPIQLTVLSSMFLHGGFMHLGGNMLYLWIFGDQIEDLLGHAKFAIFYLICGVVAAGAQIIASTGSHIPMVGASGAIAGVMGAYLVKFPRNPIRVLGRFGVQHVPAVMMLGLWIVIQLISQAGVGPGGEGGVAYLAHIGGFVAGIVMVFLFARGPVRHLSSRQGES
jgi:membrane associated rhomboid family serine protease